MQKPSSNQQPHRPGPLHQTNKAHKGSQRIRKSSASLEIKTKTLGKPNFNQTRGERLNQASQIRRLKRSKAFDEKRKIGSEAQPPLLIGCLDVHLNSCLSMFNDLLESSEQSGFKATKVNSRSIYVISNRLKMRFKLIALDYTNFDETLDIAKTIDMLMFIHRPHLIDGELDQDLSKLIRAITIHCLPTIINVLYGINSELSSKQMLEAKRILRAQASDDKVLSVERHEDYSQVFNIAGSCKRIKSKFKESRTIVETDTVQVVDNCLTFTGFVRNRRMSPNDLVHIVGFGDYQIKQIDIISDVVSLKQNAQEPGQVVEVLTPDLMKQESLDQENEIDPMQGEQTWPTAEELAAEAERQNIRTIKKRLPKGTSEYQGAWILDEDEHEEGNDDGEEDDDDDDESLDELQPRGLEKIDEADEKDDEDMKMDADQCESQCDEENDNDNRDNVSMMDVDEYDKNNVTDKDLNILEKLRLARMDAMFPDEMDTPIDTPARYRFARYRGLKSFRTSSWDPQENLPPDYSRIFQFKNFQQTKRRVMNETPQIGADPGLYVRVHVKDVPSDFVEIIINRSQDGRSGLPALTCLLKHERKMTLMNFLIKRTPDSNLKNPIRSKDELIFYVGFRKFMARPLFSNHEIASKFKNERYLRDDVAMVATMYAPVTMPPAPVLVFRQHVNGNTGEIKRELVASGSVLDSNPNRMIIKRIRLSGHPFKIHSKVAVVRFMFFNPEDIVYFKPIELITRYSRRGHILEPLGTHGHMKCIFDKKIRSDDCIFMSLYKRVYPKWNYTPLYDV